LGNDEYIQTHKLLVIGDGANILFTRNFDGAVIKIATKEIRVTDEDDAHVLLEVDAGLEWHELVLYAVSRNLGGIENMALIPGLVGAAPIGNIAAYGQNFSDVCEKVTALELDTGKVREFAKGECGFVYRDSIFKNQLKGKFLILSVIIRLQKSPTTNTEYWSKKHGSVGDILAKSGPGPYTIRDVMEAVIAIRKTKFPDMTEFGTAGSFYKNPVVTRTEYERVNKLVPGVQYYPVKDLHYVKNDSGMKDALVKISAGDILDNGMGYKGLWIRNVGLYEKHALVLVTNGNATPDEVLAFADKVERDFYTFCGIRLEREVITI
jgi:UDP-N-acetylmuramate dehydrogenase